MRFVREPKMVQEVRIGFDSVAIPFTHGYTFFDVHYWKLLLRLNLVRTQMKVFSGNTPQRLFKSLPAID